MEHDTASAQWAGGLRDGYPAGVPCWIDSIQPDPRAAAQFYGGLLGWELEDTLPPNAPGQYVGGTVVSSPIDIPYARVLQIRDPQGASLTLSQFKMPE